MYYKSTVPIILCKYNLFYNKDYHKQITIFYNYANYQNINFRYLIIHIIYLYIFRIYFSFKFFSHCSNHQYQFIRDHES